MSDWYLATSKPRQEIRAVENLLNQGIEAFSPIIKVEKIRAGKKSVVSEALFSGYIFIKLSQTDGLWHKVKSTRGIRDWVKFSGQVAKLPNKLVESLISQEQLSSDQVVKKCFNAGDKVSILSGPFQGLNGVYQASSGLERSMILIDFLGKVNRLQVDNVYLKSE